MPEMHLRQPQFTYSACGPFTKHKQRIQKFKETGDTNYINKNELDKTCFAHDAAYSDSKDLLKRSAADIEIYIYIYIYIYKIKHLILLKIQNMMGIKED